MSDSDRTRREFLAWAGALGLGASLAIPGCATARGGTSGQAAPPTALRVPTRPFGKTGARVSALALGGYVDAVAKPELLDRAFELGVTYWETTLHRGGRAYGAYFQRHPDRRSEIFLLAKTRPGDAAAMASGLELALAESATSHIDFFVAQGVDETGFLDAEVRKWVERAKREGRIRYFGIATHRNMAPCLRAAARLGWIDGVLTAYNYRLMQQPELQDAVGACAEAGIALTAIKSQGLPTNPAATLGDEGPAARQLLARLRATGLSEPEARLMAVWSNPDIASICSMMGDEATLRANANAAARWDRLASADLLALGAYACATASAYCAGCAAVCEPRAAGVPIADLMRYLVYARGYGDPERARAAYRALSEPTRAAVARQDYSLAEASCPRRLPIGKLMRAAAEELA